MRRMRAIAGAGALLAVVAVCSVARAEDPTGGIIPERKDLYSVYSDAYFNPDSAAGPACHNAPDGKELNLSLPRLLKYYVGGEMAGFNRNAPNNRILVQRQNPLVDGEFIILLQTNEFDFGNQNNYKFITGVELPSGNKVEFTYFWTSNFAATPIRTDQAGTSILGNLTTFGAASYDFDFKGAELLYRRGIFDYCQHSWDIDLLMSIRYLGTSEGFQFRDSLDRMETNLWQNIVGPELGLNAKRPFCGFFEVDLTGKMGAGANFQKNRLAMGTTDGPILIESKRESSNASLFFEGRFAINFYPHQNVKLYAGWEFIYINSSGTAIGEMQDEVFATFRPNQNDHVMYDGFFVGGEVKF